MKLINIRKIYNFCAFIIIVLITISCGKEAPTVNLGDYIVSGSDTGTGYSLPIVTAIYPADGDIDVPVSTSVVVVFNIPIDASTVSSGIQIYSPIGTPLYEGAAADYTIVTGTNYEIINFNSNLPNSQWVQIYVLSSIQDRDNGNYLDLANSISLPVEFWTSDSADATAPLAAGFTPASGATGVSMSLAAIQATFNETIDPSTVNNSTFYLTRDYDGSTVDTTASYTDPNVILTLNENLLPYEWYTVHLTNGVKDMSGNAYTEPIWNFRTVQTTDITAPTLSGSGPSIGSITGTTAVINWTTNEPTNYTINYGTSTAFGSNESDLAVYLVHSATLTGLTAGKRYYYRIVMTDEFGNSTTSATYIFNTQTPEAPAPSWISTTTAGNQMMAQYIPLKAGVTATGAFVFWYNGTYHITGELFNSSFMYQWGSGSGIGLFPDNYRYLSAVEDETGGVIVLASNGGAGVYAKRISGGSFVNWGTDADAEGDTGVPIDAAGTKGSAVPVYSGLITTVATGTVEMSSMGLPNYFADFDNDLSGLADGSDRIMDPDNHNGTTIDNNTVAQDYYYILGQTAAGIIAAGDDYYIGDGVTNTNSFTAQNHTMYVAGAYNNATNTVYTEHLTAAEITALYTWLNVGDIIRNGTNYGIVTAINEIDLSNRIALGTESADRFNHLINGGATWTVSVSAGDLAVRTAGPAYAIISAVNNDTDLTLSSDIFPNGNEAYTLHDTIDSGQADVTPSSFRLIDTGAGNTWLTDVSVGDIVVETDITYSTVISTTTVQNVISDSELQLVNDRFTDGNEYYIIYDSANLDAGTANPNRPLHLINGGATWVGTVDVNDLVRNTATNAYARVDAVTNTDLTLNADIFSGAGNNGYEIYDEFCTTHITNGTTDPIDSFLQLTVDWSIGVANGSTIYLYDNLGTYGSPWTADTPPANPLYDNNPTQVFTYGTAPYPVVDGDIVYNSTDTLIAEVTVSSFTIDDHALDLSANIFTDGDAYRILRCANVAEFGSAQAGTTGTTLVVTANTGAIVGDVVYNVTDSVTLGYPIYTRITRIVGTSYTMMNNASLGVGDEYIICHATLGVLYVWQEAGPLIRGTVRGFAPGGTPGTIVGEWTIANGSNPYTVTDGRGNAFVVYNDTSANSQIQVQLVNEQGVYAGAYEIDTNNTSANYAETILKVMSDDSGGVLILYQYNNGSGVQVMRVQRITHAGTTYTRQYGAGGRSVGNTVSINTTNPVGDAVDMVYDTTGGSQIVVAQIGAGYDIWAARIGASTWSVYVSNPTGTSIQQKPKVYVNDWAAGYARIVWEDNRFVTGGGYGIFGQLVTATTGALTNWYADSASTDNDGVAVVLNAENGYWPNTIIVPYNNNAAANIIWDDYRNGTAADLRYMSLSTFSPY